MRCTPHLRPNQAPRFTERHRLCDHPSSAVFWWETDRTSDVTEPEKMWVTILYPLVNCHSSRTGKSPLFSSVNRKSIIKLGHLYHSKLFNDHPLTIRRSERAGRKHHPGIIPRATITPRSIQRSSTIPSGVRDPLV